MKNFDVCVLGGGASGSICAIELAKKRLSVCVIDGCDFPAKKLLVTGNGRCNLTNKNMSSEFYNQNIDKYLKKYSFLDTIGTFKSFGLETYFDEEGRCYPVSNSAKSVCFVIKNQFEKLNISFFGNQNVVSISKRDGYVIKTDADEFCCNNLVVATGHNSNILEMMEKLGEKTKKFVPSLVALKTKENTKRLSGTRLSDVAVFGVSNNKKMAEKGEVLFKDNGLSGICIFNLSTLFSQHNFEGEIQIDLLLKYSYENITEILLNNKQIFQFAGELLQGILQKEVAFEILKRANISPETKIEKLTEKDVKNIVQNIKSLSFEVCGCYGNNQVCLGGILLESLTENLQSKQNENLYFCGEICDVIGICGGYNLQWAFTSANIVARKIAKL